MLNNKKRIKKRHIKSSSSNCSDCLGLFQEQANPASDRRVRQSRKSSIEMENKLRQRIELKQRNIRILFWPRSPFLYTLQARWTLPHDPTEGCCLVLLLLKVDSIIIELLWSFRGFGGNDSIATLFSLIPTNFSWFLIVF